MTDDLVKRLRQALPCGDMRCPEMSHAGGCTCGEAADRIEQLEAALKHIWAFYPISVSNPRETIDAIRDFAFNALEEKKDE